MPIVVVWTCINSCQCCFVYECLGNCWFSLRGETTKAISILTQLVELAELTNSQFLPTFLINRGTLREDGFRLLTAVLRFQTILLRIPDPVFKIPDSNPTWIWPNIENFRIFFCNFYSLQSWYKIFTRNNAPIGESACDFLRIRWKLVRWQTFKKNFVFWNIVFFFFVILCVKIQFPMALEICNTSNLSKLMLKLFHK